MKRWATYVTALIGIVAVAVALAWSPPEATREGQVLFVPSPSVESPVDPKEAGRVEVEACRMTSEGLIVSGRVETEPGVVTVLVSGGDLRSPGVRVGRASLSHSRAVGDVPSGYFRVLLAWAGLESDFAVVANPGSDVAHGAISSCP